MVWSPFSEAEFNILLNTGYFIMTGGMCHLATIIPCFVMAIEQVVKKESKDLGWFYTIAYELFLLQKLSSSLQKDFLKRCINNYKSIQHKPAFFYKKGLIWHLERLMKYNDESNKMINYIIDYLSNSINSTSSLYKVLINELQNIPILYDDLQKGPSF